MNALIQVLALAFAIFAVSRAVLRARDKKISIAELVFWITVWLALILVVMFPYLTNYLARVMGIGRGIDVVVYLSIGLLFYLIFRLYVKIEETQKSITLLVREIAIYKKENKKNKKNKPIN